MISIFKAQIEVSVLTTTILTLADIREEEREDGKMWEINNREQVLSSSCLENKATPGGYIWTKSIFVYCQADLQRPVITSDVKLI